MLLHLPLPMRPNRFIWSTKLMQGCLMAGLLATVITLHIEGRVLLDTEHSLLSRLRTLAHIWFGQLAVASTMLVVIARRYPQVPPPPGGRRGALTRLVLWTAAAGLLVQALMALPRLHDSMQLVRGLAFGGLWNLSLATLLVLGHDFAQRSKAAAQALHEAELRGLGLQREMDEAHLQLLQAQVEPHFLFNALANVRRLLRTEPAAAHTLLGDLLRYLQEALPALRHQHTTLGREAELVRAFLAVHQVRMAARLHAEVDVPPELSSVEVPSMVLLSLIENALKHGLQPLVDGGSIHVSARAADGRLTLTVTDTGRGMGSGSGGGTGLANLRARLRSFYGNEASLALAVNVPRGVIATVELPWPRPAMRSEP